MKIARKEKTARKWVEDRRQKEITKGAATFELYMEKQTNRPDRIGDAARIIAREGGNLTKLEKITDWQDLLTKHKAPQRAFFGLRDAYVYFYDLSEENRESIDYEKDVLIA
ncbi:MAG: hypothetical protein GY835_24875 [bacterium]|nr:hypothetical protein [bacterium]